MLGRSFLSRTAIVLAGLAAIFPLSSVASAKEWKTATITLEGACPHRNLTNPDGTLGGFEPEFAACLSAHMKVECQIVVSGRDSMIASLMRASST